MSAPELIDTHCHLNFTSYADDRMEVLARASDAGVKLIIIPAIDLPSCNQAIELAGQHDGVYAAVGVHPNSCGEFAQSHVDELRAFSRHQDIVAIGEIGLDYYWDKCPKPTQHSALEAQLELAADLELPVILHNREAASDLMAILEAWAPQTASSLRGRLGALHSFSASLETAQRAIDLGFFIGFTGPVTYKKADELRAIATSLPQDRIIIETDGPFLAPQERRGKRNEPAYLPFINRKLAELHGVSAEEMAQRTTANAKRLFALL
ncbi:MAG: TatD family hydrolase [Chloroflexi bacterium]|nr:TatD family hydrolase [Chloroflexota bacterium]